MTTLKLEVLEECGYMHALRGLAYSFKDRAEDVSTWWAAQQERATKRANILAHRQGGHNKFLESIQVWLDIEATRGWWSEMDTYRAGVTKQSESTMHTLLKRSPQYTDFSCDTDMSIISAFKACWYYAQAMEGHRAKITYLKANLPEGYLQRRVVCLNYKALQGIVAQRHDHNLEQGREFCKQLEAEVNLPQFIWKEDSAL